MNRFMGVHVNVVLVCMCVYVQVSVYVFVYIFICVYMCVYKRSVIFLHKKKVCKLANQTDLHQNLSLYVHAYNKNILIQKNKNKL